MADARAADVILHRLTIPDGRYRTFIRDSLQKLYRRIHLSKPWGPMTLLSILAKQNLSAIFNERDPKKRLAAVKELWAADGVLWTADGTYIGHKAIEKAAASTLRNYPEYDYSAEGSTDEIPDAARMQWSLGTDDGPPALSGLDVIVVSDGCIMAMYRFLDGAEL